MSKKTNSRETVNISDKWNDESFVAEMEAEYNYYLNGGKMVSAEEAEKGIDELRIRLRG